MHQRNIYPLCKRSKNAASNAMSDRQAGGQTDRHKHTHTHMCENTKKRDKHEHTHGTHRTTATEIRK